MSAMVAVKLKRDENLPRRFVDVLAALGHDVDSVPEERRSRRDDGAVWEAAQSASRFLITQDLDFADAPWLIQPDEEQREAFFDRVSSLFAFEDVENWNGALVSATTRKVRVKRPARQRTPPAIGRRYLSRTARSTRCTSQRR
jgi:hypothetical protein